jgi:hypothetical protein
MRKSALALSSTVLGLLGLHSLALLPAEAQKPENRPRRSRADARSCQGRPPAIAPAKDSIEAAQTVVVFNENDPIRRARALLRRQTRHPKDQVVAVKTVKTEEITRPEI